MVLCGCCLAVVAGRGLVEQKPDAYLTPLHVACQHDLVTIAEVRTSSGCFQGWMGTRGHCSETYRGVYPFFPRLQPLAC